MKQNTNTEWYTQQGLAEYLHRSLVGTFSDCEREAWYLLDYAKYVSLERALNGLNYLMWNDEPGTANAARYRG